MWHGSRRSFLRFAGAAAAGAALSPATSSALLQAAQPRRPEGVKILTPQARVPLSVIIDDSTCLVNMGHFCTPQFAEARPNQDVYKKDWKAWPREIPDAFVREFGEWCGEHGVKGKYSIVPNPACVGWLDRELPGWSRRELLDSLKLVRELMLPDWDIHPEMITHTRVIDLKTGRPFEEISDATMENSYPQEKKSVDELTAYLAYALRILKNCDLPCEGITTPGGFGNMVKTELSQAVQESVRDVYAAEIPHYFKYVNGGDESTDPTLEHVSGLDTDDVRLTVNIPAGTGDWFGGWQGDNPPQGHRYANEDATEGRMVDLIERGQPALMLFHWPGMYCNGTRQGFDHFKQVVVSLNDRFGDRTIWLKLTEIARYWAAKELTRIERKGTNLTLDAPFATSRFTLRVTGFKDAAPKLTASNNAVALRQVSSLQQLKTGTWMRQPNTTLLCFDLPKGRSVVTL